MRKSKAFKGLLAGLVLASGLLVSTPLAPTVVEAATYYDYAGKPLDLNKIEFGTFEEMKDFAVELFVDPEFDPGAYLVYTKENYKDQFYDYVSRTGDMSQDVPLFTYYGRGAGVKVRQITKGVYENIITIGSDFYEYEELQIEKGIDKAEAYIVKNYTLNTEYEVVYAINNFIASNLEYGKGTKNNPYLIEGMNTTCTGYTDFASRLYHRFGIESRAVVGDAPNGPHDWNAVKLGGKWYYSDATYVDNVKFSEKHVLFTQDFRDKEGFKNYRSAFRATNDAFDKSKSVAYNYKAVKAAQAKK